MEARTISPAAGSSKPKLSIAVRESDQIDWVTSIPMLGMHLAAVAGLLYFPFTWKAAALVVGFYYLRMFGITAGFHRYFSHRTYKMGRVMQFLMALLGTLSVQKGVLWWSAHHRHHHKYSDKPEDVHSPIQRGFWWSHVGWILAKTWHETDMNQVRDLAKYPELVWLNKNFLVPVVTWGVIMACFGLDVFFWGFLVSTVVLWHGTYTVNSLTHVFGKKRYDSGDESRNSFLIALITMGEGWHNNHHHYMSSTRQGFFWWEFDPSYYILKGFEKLGLVSDLREPPAHLFFK